MAWVRATCSIDCDLPRALEYLLATTPPVPVHLASSHLRPRFFTGKGKCDGAVILEGSRLENDAQHLTIGIQCCLHLPFTIMQRQRAGHQVSCKTQRPRVIRGARYFRVGLAGA